MAAGYNIPESDALEHARRRALDQLRRELRVLPQPEQPDQLRAHLEHRLLPLQADRRGHAADAVRPGDGLLGHPEARHRSRSTRTRRTSTTSSSRRRRAGTVQGEKDEILTKTVVIHFFPNSWDLNKKVTRTARRQGSRGAVRSERRLRGRGDRQAGRPVRRRADRDRGAHRRLDDGGQVPKSLVKELSLNRANAVKEALVRKFPTCSPNQFSTAGIGWDRPADDADPENRPRTAASRSRSTRRKSAPPPSRWPRRR